MSERAVRRPDRRPGRIGRYVRMVAQPGQRDALAATLLRVADGLRDAPGCELYLVNVSADEADTVWITELWTSAAASDEALGRDLVDLSDVEIGDLIRLLAGPPELVALTPLGGAGFPRSDPRAPATSPPA